MEHVLCRTRIRSAAAAAVLPLAALAGCESTGLSPREAAGRNFSSYVYALDTPAPAALAALDGDGSMQPGNFVAPTKLAVAQVGEVAPPTSFLKKLRARPALFARVEGISGAVGADPGEVRAREGNDSTLTAEARARQEMARIQRVARNMGMDHLLLVGGTIDQVTKENGLGVLDLTIVGAFVAPSKQLDAEAKAAGALIELSSGRVVLFASADASRTRVASSMTQRSGEIDVMRETRDQVLAELAGEVVRQCEQQAQAAREPG
jgi:hypothetical protein